MSVFLHDAHPVRVLAHRSAVVSPLEGEIIGPGALGDCLDGHALVDLPGIGDEGPLPEEPQPDGKGGDLAVEVQGACVRLRQVEDDAIRIATGLRAPLDLGLGREDDLLAGAVEGVRSCRQYAVAPDRDVAIPTGLALFRVC